MPTFRKGTSRHANEDFNVGRGLDVSQDATGLPEIRSTASQYNARDHVIGDNSSERSTFNNLVNVTMQQTSGGILTLPDGYRIAIESNMDIPSNVHIDPRGGRIVVRPGVSVKHFGSVMPLPVYWIEAEGTGNMYFQSSPSAVGGTQGGMIEAVYPEWWGARGRGTTDETAAMQKCWASIRDTFYGKGPSFSAWGPYGSAFSATGNIQITQNANGTVDGKALGSTGWDAQIYSNFSFNGYAYAAAKCQLGDVLIGLNADPMTNASWETIDYGINQGSGGSLDAFESGTYYALNSSWAVGDKLAVRYYPSGANSIIEYTKNGAVLRTVTTTPNRTFFFDSSFYGPRNSEMRQMQFTQTATVPDEMLLTEGNDFDGGLQSVSVMPIKLIGTRYKISEPLTMSAVSTVVPSRRALVVVSDNQSHIEQLNPTKDIIDLRNAYQVNIRGLRTIGGKAHYWYQSGTGAPNSDNNPTSIILHDISCYGAKEVALRMGGVSTGFIPISVESDGFRRHDGGSFIVDGFTEGMNIGGPGNSDNFESTVFGGSSPYKTAADGWTPGGGGIAGTTLPFYSPASGGVTASKITVNIAAPYTAMTPQALKGNRRLMGWVGNDSLNAFVSVHGGTFINNRAIVHDRTEEFLMDGRVWVQFDERQVPANTAQFTNRASRMYIHNLFGIPDVKGGLTQQHNQRWVDNYGAFYLINPRLGSEGGGGIAGIKHRLWLNAGNHETYDHTAAVVVEGGYVTSGTNDTHFATIRTPGLVEIAEGVPSLLRIIGTRGLPTHGGLEGARLLSNTGPLNLATHFAAYTAAGKDVHDFFRMKVDQNLIANHGSIPTEIRQFLQRPADNILAPNIAHLTSYGFDIAPGGTWDFPIRASGDAAWLITVKASANEQVAGLYFYSTAGSAFGVLTQIVANSLVGVVATSAGIITLTNNSGVTSLLTGTATRTQ